MLGKRICGAVIKEGDGSPRMQIFLIFDDGTYYEIYSDVAINGIGGVYEGDIEFVRQYMPEHGITFEIHAETPYKTLELFDDD